MPLFTSIDRLNWKKGLSRIFLIFCLFWISITTYIAYEEGIFSSIRKYYKWEYSNDYIIQQINNAANIYREELHSNQRITGNQFCLINTRIRPAISADYDLSSIPCVLESSCPSLSCGELWISLSNIQGRDYNDPETYILNANELYELLVNKRLNNFYYHLGNASLIIFGGPMAFIILVLLFVISYKTLTWISKGFTDIES